ncbi:hypothetical protein BC332_27748 [Capsicum chinense]|nr:hypothetical protein BC332_27748 [Capsicum chinense]
MADEFCNSRGVKIDAAAKIVKNAYEGIDFEAIRNMVTHNLKMKEELHKLRKDKLKVITIKMQDVLKEKEDVTVETNSYDLKDLIYAMEEKLKQVRGVMKVKVGGEGSQPFVG